MPAGWNISTSSLFGEHFMSVHKDGVDQTCSDQVLTSDKSVHRCECPQDASIRISDLISQAT